MQRQLALEVIVTLSETAAAMLRKHTNIVAQTSKSKLSRYFSNEAKMLSKFARVCVVSQIYSEYETVLRIRWIWGVFCPCLYEPNLMDLPLRLCRSLKPGISIKTGILKYLHSCSSESQCREGGHDSRRAHMSVVMLHTAWSFLHKLVGVWARLRKWLYPRHLQFLHWVKSFKNLSEQGKNLTVSVCIDNSRQSVAVTYILRLLCGVRTDLRSLLWEH